jgi:hypothetical protein
MNNRLIVSSPPRSGNNFLNFMINKYISTNKLDSDFYEYYVHHKPQLLLSDEYSKCLTIIRNPKDVFLSILVFSYKEEGFGNIDQSFEFFKNNYLNFLTNLKLSDKSYYVLFDDLITDVNSIIYKVFYSLDNNCPKPNLDPEAFKESDHPLRNNIYKSPMHSKDSNKDLKAEFLSKIDHISFVDIENEIVNLLVSYPQKRIQ